jgi:hypothetical protein
LSFVLIGASITISSDESFINTNQYDYFYNAYKNIVEMSCLSLLCVFLERTIIDVENFKVKNKYITSNIDYRKILDKLLYSNALYSYLVKIANMIVYTNENTIQ